MARIAVANFNDRRPGDSTMPMRAARLCAKCIRLAMPGTSYCPAHQNAAAIADKARKRNDRWKKFYDCKLWRIFTRQSVLMRDGGQCVRVTNGVRCPRLATDVHHKIEPDVWVTQMGNDFYDTDNLESLCHEHHSGVTGRAHGWDAR
jgi:hypothetical protein